MIEEPDFESFLYISENQYTIFVDDKKNSKNLYKQEFKIDDKINPDDLSYLPKFLDENIYRIEKLVGNFIKDITLIIENDKILNTDIGIKKKDTEQLQNQDNIKNYLMEVKDLFKENYQDQVIMHMLINDSDENATKNLSHDSYTNEGYLYLSVKFISISNNLTSVFEKILEKHQIQVNQYMSGEYMQSFFGSDISELSIMASKLKNGLNKNEITLVSKNTENKGFFEKFFQLFS
jgi:hypothetical protein